MRTVSLWCGTCGKACGRLKQGDAGWAYIGQMSLPPTSDDARHKSPVEIPVASPEDADGSDRAVSVGVTCTSGHYLWLEVDEIWRDLRSGCRSLTVW